MSVSMSVSMTWQYRRLLNLLAIGGSLAAVVQVQANSLKIVDKLMDCCSKNRSGAIVDTIVLHFSSDLVANPINPYNVDNVIGVFKTANVSAHYLIDREGTIYRLVKEEDQAYHAGAGKLPRDLTRTELNDTSIGIELLAIGTQKEMEKIVNEETYARVKNSDRGYTEKQYNSLMALLTDITGRRKDIKMNRKHIIGHDEYAPDRKTDPGSLFDWTKIGLGKTP